MPSANFNQRDARTDAGRARVGRIDLDPATRREVESAADPLWGQFFRTWESLAAAKGRYPARNEIDPAALGAKLLPNVFLVDVVDTAGLAAPRFRFRLLGQGIIEREPTRAGDFVDEIGSTTDVAAIERHYIACLEGKISIREASLVWSDPRGGYLRYRVMMLPLSEEGESVTHLIGLVLYEF